MAGAKAQLTKIFAQNRMRALLPETSVCVFRIKTRSRKVTEVQPAVGCSVRRKPLVCSYGAELRRGQNLFQIFLGEVRPSGRTLNLNKNSPAQRHHLRY